MGFRSTMVRNRQPEYTEKKDSTKYCLYSQRTQAFLFYKNRFSDLKSKN
nr:MAG TPA: hypothetical protein [Bacteriophage sp.]